MENVYHFVVRDEDFKILAGGTTYGEFAFERAEEWAKQNFPNQNVHVENEPEDDVIKNRAAGLYKKGE